MRRSSLGKEFVPIKNISISARAELRNKNDSNTTNSNETKDTESNGNDNSNFTDQKVDEKPMDFVSEMEVWENQSWKAVRSIHDLKFKFPISTNSILFLYF